MLAALEHEKIDAELKEKRALIEELKLILKSPTRIVKIIKEEVAGLKEKYGDERRTQVIARAVEAKTRYADAALDRETRSCMR